MNSGTGMLLGVDRPIIDRVALSTLLAIPVLSAVAALAWGALWLAVPWAVAVLTLAFFQPRIGLYVLIFSWFFRVGVLGIPGAFPADVILLPVVAGYICRQLLAGQRVVTATPLNRLALVWLGLYFISLSVNAVNPALGAKNWLRHVELFALFVAALGLLDRVTIQRTLSLFLGMCLVFSASNVLWFLSEEGTIRAFGTAHALFSGYLAIATPLAVAFGLLATRRSHRRLWTLAVALFIMAQISNQSRGAMLQLLSGLLFAAIVAYRWGMMRGQTNVRGRLLKMGAVVTVAGVLMVGFAGRAIGRAVHRYSTASGSDMYTLQTRDVLWTSAVRMFLDHPIVGVGPAQTLELRAYLPDIRFNPIHKGIEGLGTHNSLLRYLAECGLVGSLVLWLLLWRALSLGRGILRNVRDSGDAAWHVGVWGAVFVITSRFLYEGHIFYSISGMTTVVFVAMLYRLRHPRLADDRTR